VFGSLTRFRQRKPPKEVLNPRIPNYNDAVVSPFAEALRTCYTIDRSPLNMDAWQTNFLSLGNLQCEALGELLIRQATLCNLLGQTGTAENADNLPNHNDSLYRLTVELPRP
jgi:hypothetical protein